MTVVDDQTGCHDGLLLFLLQVSRQVGLVVVVLMMVMLVVEQAIYKVVLEGIVQLMVMLIGRHHILVRLRVLHHGSASHNHGCRRADRRAVRLVTR